MSTIDPNLVSDGTTTALEEGYRTNISIIWHVGEAHRPDGTIDRYAKRDGVFQKVATIPPEES